MKDKKLINFICSNCKHNRVCKHFGKVEESIDIIEDNIPIDSESPISINISCNHHEEIVGDNDSVIEVIGSVCRGRGFNCCDCKDKDTCKDADLESSIRVKNNLQNIKGFIFGLEKEQWRKED